MRLCSCKQIHAHKKKPTQRVGFFYSYGNLAATAHEVAHLDAHEDPNVLVAAVTAVVNKGLVQLLSGHRVNRIVLSYDGKVNESIGNPKTQIH